MRGTNDAKPLLNDTVVVKAFEHLLSLNRTISTAAPLDRQAWSSEAIEGRSEGGEKGHTEEQILRALRKAESGAKVADLCREHGISEATFYIYGRLPSGKKVAVPGLTVIDCKHLSGVTV